MNKYWYLKTEIIEYTMKIYSKRYNHYVWEQVNGGNVLSYNFRYCKPRTLTEHSSSLTHSRLNKAATSAAVTPCILVASVSRVGKLLLNKKYPPSTKI